MAGLLPIMWSTGTGSEIMQRIAVPMIGGMISSTLLTLIVIPAIYGLIKGFRLPANDRGNGHPHRGPLSPIKEDTRLVSEPAQWLNRKIYRQRPSSSISRSGNKGGQQCTSP
jgi:Cu(I)/Ag(I) efflux system membrane protein CusA/SilA